MIAVNYSTARDNFEKYCDAAVRDAETIVVTRRDDENIVLLSESEYNNLIENLYVRADKSDYALLLSSIEQLKSGRGKERELAPDE